MKTNLIRGGLVLTVFATVACTHDQTANSGNQRAARTAQNDPRGNQRMITGSNVPQPVNRPTYSRTSANVPSSSFDRHPDSLVPTEPVVGAGGKSDYRLDEPDTGAAPAGSVPNTGGH